MEKTKKTLYEVQKKYLICAVIMMIMGMLITWMGKTSMGISVIIFGTVFLIGFFVLIAKDGMQIVDDIDSGGKEENADMLTAEHDLEGNQEAPLDEQPLDKQPLAEEALAEAPLDEQPEREE